MYRVIIEDSKTKFQQIRYFDDYDKAKLTAHVLEKRHEEEPHIKITFKGEKENEK